MQLTIFTPTYNRANYLEKLYCSLLKQSSNEFKWIIVDDGSIDNTEEIVRKFIDEKRLCIEYYKQKNSGKHIAHNKGVELCDTELFFCVDSDDYLTEDSVEVILNIWNSRKQNKNITGIVALKGYRNNKVMKNYMPRDIQYSTLSDLYNIHGKKGETALIFKTEYLKSNMFPKFENEKFLSEEVVYNEIDKIGKLSVSNNIIYIMEYLEDGITNNYIKAWKSSPKGVIYLLNSRYRSLNNLKGLKKYILYFKVILVLNSFCIDRKIKIYSATPNKFLSSILYIPSFFIWVIKFYRK